MRQQVKLSHMHKYVCVCMYVCAHAQLRRWCEQDFQTRRQLKFMRASEINQMIVDGE